MELTPTYLIADPFLPAQAECTLKGDIVDCRNGARRQALMMGSTCLSPSPLDKHPSLPPYYLRARKNPSQTHPRPCKAPSPRGGSLCFLPPGISVMSART